MPGLKTSGCGCCEACSGAVDVVIADKRYTLRCDGNDLVWTADLPAGTLHRAAYAKNFEGTCLITRRNAGEGKNYLHAVDIADGDDLGVLYEETAARELIFLSQEASVTASVVSYEETDPFSGIVNVTPTGVVETAAYIPFADPSDFGAIFRVGEKLYWLDQDARLVRRNDLSGGPFDVEDWVDLSSAYAGSDEPLWMLWDDDRNQFYVIGYDADGDLLVVRVTDGGSVVTLVSSDLPVGGNADAFTLLGDGLWWISGDDVWHYDIAAGALELVVHRESGTWPAAGSSDPLYNDGVGKAFIVGRSETCNQACGCSPTVDVARSNWTAAPPETYDEETPYPGCFYEFDYAIELCEGRTLKQLVFQGTRGSVSIDGVGPVADVDDWEAVPLEGMFFFNFFSGGCGPRSGTLRLTVIDSANCCTRVEIAIDCCNCCAPEATVTVAEDVCPGHPDCYLGACDAPTGECTHEGSPCICDLMCYYEWDFPSEGTVTDCEEIGANALAGFLVDWDAMEHRDGVSSLPGFVAAGSTVRTRINYGCAGQSACVGVRPVDVLGCVGEPTYFEFGNGFDPIDCPP